MVAGANVPPELRQPDGRDIERRRRSPEQPEQPRTPADMRDFGRRVVAGELHSVETTEGAYLQGLEHLNVEISPRLRERVRAEFVPVEAAAEHLEEIEDAAAPIGAPSPETSRPPVESKIRGAEPKITEIPNIRIQPEPTVVIGGRNERRPEIVARTETDPLLDSIDSTRLDDIPTGEPLGEALPTQPAEPEIGYTGRVRLKAEPTGPASLGDEPMPAEPHIVENPAMTVERVGQANELIDNYLNNQNIDLTGVPNEMLGTLAEQTQARINAIRDNYKKDKALSKKDQILHDRLQQFKADVATHQALRNLVERGNQPPTPEQLKHLTKLNADLTARVGQLLPLLRLYPELADRAKKLEGKTGAEVAKALAADPTFFVDLAKARGRLETITPGFVSGSEYVVEQTADTVKVKKVDKSGAPVTDHGGHHSGLVRTVVSTTMGLPEKVVGGSAGLAMRVAHGVVFDAPGFALDVAYYSTAGAVAIAANAWKQRKLGLDVSRMVNHRLETAQIEALYIQIQRQHEALNETQTRTLGAPTTEQLAQWRMAELYAERYADALLRRVRSSQVQLENLDRALRDPALSKDDKPELERQKIALETTYNQARQQYDAFMRDPRTAAEKIQIDTAAGSVDYVDQEDKRVAVQRNEVTADSNPLQQQQQHLELITQHTGVIHRAVGDFLRSNAEIISRHLKVPPTALATAVTEGGYFFEAPNPDTLLVRFHGENNPLNGRVLRLPTENTQALLRTLEARPATTQGYLKGDELTPFVTLNTTDVRATLTPDTTPIPGAIDPASGDTSSSSDYDESPTAAAQTSEASPARAETTRTPENASALERAGASRALLGTITELSRSHATMGKGIFTRIREAHEHNASLVVRCDTMGNIVVGKPTADGRGVRDRLATISPNIIETNRSVYSNPVYDLLRSRQPEAITTLRKAEHSIAVSDIEVARTTMANPTTVEGRPRAETPIQPTETEPGVTVQQAVEQTRELQRRLRDCLDSFSAEPAKTGQAISIYSKAADLYGKVQDALLPAALEYERQVNDGTSAEAERFSLQNLRVTLSETNLTIQALKDVVGNDRTPELRSVNIAVQVAEVAQRQLESVIAAGRANNTAKADRTAPPTPPRTPPPTRPATPATNSTPVPPVRPVAEPIVRPTEATRSTERERSADLDRLVNEAALIHKPDSTLPAVRRLLDMMANLDTQLGDLLQMERYQNPLNAKIRGAMERGRGNVAFASVERLRNVAGKILTLQEFGISTWDAARALKRDSLGLSATELSARQRSLQLDIYTAAQQWDALLPMLARAVEDLKTTGAPVLEQAIAQPVTQAVDRTIQTNRQRLLQALRTIDTTQPIPVLTQMIQRPGGVARPAA